jgi:hypothetical protein
MTDEQQYPHVQPGWQFHPDQPAMSAAGMIGEITARGIDGDPDLVRADYIYENGRRGAYGNGRSYHASEFAAFPPVENE